MEKQPFFANKRNVVFVALIYTFLWGSAFPLVKMCMDGFQIEAMDNISKCLVAGIRFFVAGIFTLIWCVFSDKTKLSVNKKQMWYILLYGVLVYCLQYALTYIGLSRIDGAKGAILDQLCVFIIVLCSGIFFKDDALSVRKIIGCVFGFSGILLCNAKGVSFEFTLGGEGIMLLATLCQTAAYFIAKASGDTVSSVKLVGYGELIGGGLLAVYALLMGGRIFVFSANAILVLLILSVISAVAYVLSLMPLKYFPASEISSFNLLITVFGVVMSALLLHENIFEFSYLVAVLLIATGIILINGRKQKHDR